MGCRVTEWSDDLRPESVLEDRTSLNPHVVFGGNRDDTTFGATGGGTR